MVDDEIGGGDIDIPVGPGDQIQIDGGADRLVIQGAVHKGLDQTVGGQFFFQVGGWPVPAELLLALLGHPPGGQEHHGEIPRRLPLHPDAAVFPVAEAHHPVDIFVRQIDSAGKRRVAVDDTDFPVIPVV